MRDNGIYALYDDRTLDTTTFINDFCDATMTENPLYDPSCTLACEDEFIDDPACLFLLDEFDRFNMRRRELIGGGTLPMPVGTISLKYLEHLVQNVFRDNGKFCPFDSSFSTNGWFADCTAYDFSAI